MDWQGSKISWILKSQYMISFSNILKKILIERMSFKDLLANTDNGRIQRSKTDVHSKSLHVTSIDGNEAWLFSYKSSPSTTGIRHKGYVRFLKEDVGNKDRADELDCMVDCSCPDFRYRFAYNNAKNDASVIGPNSLNKNNGHPPKYPRNNLIGCCKHLASLAEFLKTKIEPEAPQPDDPKPQAPVTAAPTKQTPVAPKPSIQQKPQTTAQSKPVQKPVVKAPKPAQPTINAPDPDDRDIDTYSDSRGDLTEGIGKIASNLDKLVQSEPQFQIEYED